MTGMEMMLKSMLGIDPAEIKQRVQEASKMMQDTINHFDNRLTAIETAVSEIKSKLEKE